MQLSFMDIASNPVVIVAFLGLLGIIAAQIVAIWGKKKDTDIGAMQTNISFLQAEYERLVKEVESMREELKGARLTERLLQEKYSAALAYSASLRIAARAHFAILDEKGVAHGELPVLGPPIEQDLLQRWPDAGDSSL